jgi:outer membrane protein OmpA-like peptidoglycan-associated protein
VASAAPAAPAPAATPPPPSGTALGLNILFAFNSTSVLPESVPYLERLGEVLTLPENQGKVVNIVGHTDASGGVAYNQALSEQRALAVGQYLVDVWRVDPNRLGVEGRGKSQPLAGTDPFDGINRRVEFYAIE